MQAKLTLSVKFAIERIHFTSSKMNSWASKSFTNIKINVLLKSKVNFNMKRNEDDITEGPIIPNVIRFAIPIVLSNILQITFNATDIAVVGRFCGSDAVASIGATASLINLFLNLFVGFSTGTTIVVSYALGARKNKDARRHAHSALLLSIICGFLVGILGVALARPMLHMIGIPNGAVLDGAILYFSIYFAGAPFMLLYNFGAAILRANGDSKKPFIFLLIGGITNVVLNIFFILVFNMTVEGVAFATVISNMLSSILVVRSLIKIKSPCRISYKALKIRKNSLVSILKFGLPAGIQSCMFSLPNVMIQSAVNSFGAAAIAGNAAASNVCSYVEIANVAFSETTLTFISRNYGAKKYKRIKNVILTCLLGAVSFSLVMGTLEFIFYKPLLSIFVPNNPEAISYGRIRLMFIALPNFIGATMSILTASIRGIGKPNYPMITTILGVCVVRMIWLMTVFKIYPTIECVFLTYPFTWSITSIALAIYFIYNYRKIEKNN